MENFCFGKKHERTKGFSLRRKETLSEGIFASAKRTRGKNFRCDERNGDTRSAGVTFSCEKVTKKHRSLVSEHE